MKKIALLVLCVLCCAVATAAQLPVGFTESLIAQGLDPTDLALAPDSRIFITFKSGKVVIVEDGILRPAPLIDLTAIVDNYNERGLGHIVLDPNFNTNGYYYLYYTVKGENRNRISRFTSIGNFSDPSSEVILLTLDPMAGTIHNAGDLAFGIDGKLYISVGDGADASKAQLLTSALGKILRINPDGSIPEDNPFYSSTTGIFRSIWALGFRNPFSLSINPVTGYVFACDVGQGSWEEVNHAMAGSNHGWPGIEGKRTTEALPGVGVYRDPLYTYPHGGGINAGCSIVGAAFYSPTVNQFPATYTGRFFFADYCNGYIKSVDPQNGTDVQTFATGINRPLAFVVAVDGSLYYLARAGLGGGSEGDNTSSQDGTLWKVTYTGSGAPAISVHPQPVIAAVGEQATFTLHATGIQPLSYQWLANDVEISGATAAVYAKLNVQLSDDGTEFSCRVTNAAGSVTSFEALLIVTSNTRPQPAFTVSLPGNATLYRAGQTLSLSGAATDTEDGELAASRLSWKIDFHHDSHSHPALPLTTGIGTVNYEIPTVGETSANVWYRIYLTATDLGNPALSKTIYQDVFPQKVNIELRTEPVGLYVVLDGQPIVTPFTFTSVVNTMRVLHVPYSELVGNKLYVFSHWSETYDQLTHPFDTPETDTTFVAAFSTIELGTGEGLKGEYFSNQLKTFDGTPALQRLDPGINFDWSGGSPDPAITVDHFTARWKGNLTVPVSDMYRFYLTGDDGIRMWLDDKLIINAWVDQGSATYTANVSLEANKKYPIIVEFYENGGAAVVRLEWSSDLLERQVIPATQLFDDVITAAETGIDPALWIYPTVTQKLLTVQFARRIPWQITDVLGRRLMTGYTEPTFTIDVSQLPAGLYFFTIETKAVRFAKQ